MNRRARSQILNPDLQKPNVYSLNLNDAAAVRGEIQHREAKLEDAESKIKEVRGSFEDFQDREVKAGKRKPEAIPDHLKEDLEEAQARRDLIQEEIDVLNQKLREFEDKDQNQREDKVLKRGPMGIVRLRNHEIVEVDGQRVIKDNKNLFRIAEPTSPYDGMECADYFEFIVKPWQNANHERKKQHEQKVKAYREKGGRKPRVNAPKAPWPARP